MSKADKYITKAITNIEKDREVTTELLNDVMSYIGTDRSKHAEVGHVTAKYIESLQRSNEQLVKLVTLMAKKEDSLFGDLSDDDKTNIYEQINEDNQ
jgi:hypothetical protein